MALPDSGREGSNWAVSDISRNGGDRYTATLEFLGTGATTPLDVGADPGDAAVAAHLAVMRLGLAFPGAREGAEAAILVALAHWQASVAAAEAKLPAVDLIQDLLADPDALAEEPALIPHILWPGRLTLLSSAEKVGKSTLMSQAVAAYVTGTEFFNTPVGTGAVLWLVLDESRKDLVRRLARFDVRRDVVLCRDPATPDQIHLLADRYGARIVVVDTLVEYFALTVEDFNDARNWVGPLKALRALAEDTGLSLGFLHHTVRDSTRYADSRQIGAGMEQLLTLAPPKDEAEDPTARTLDVKGRAAESSGTWKLRYVGGRYELDSAELPLPTRIYRLVDAEPGLSGHAIRDRIGAKRDVVLRALAGLVEAGVVEDRGNRGKRCYYVRPVGASAAAGPGLRLLRPEPVSAGTTRGKVESTLTDDRNLLGGLTGTTGDDTGDDTTSPRGPPPKGGGPTGDECPADGETPPREPGEDDELGPEEVPPGRDPDPCPF